MNHWKKLNYNLYRLVNNHNIIEFKTYKELYEYCMNHNIDAVQV